MTLAEAMRLRLPAYRYLPSGAPLRYELSDGVVREVPYPRTASARV
jgi:hypothetical protein